MTILKYDSGIAEAVDRRHGGDHQAVLAGHQRLGGRQAHLLDVVVDRRVLLDEGIGGRHVGLGLVVVVVGDEVLDRVVREELAELPYSCAARVLLWAMTIVGRCSSCTTCAIVNVLPEPVTPSSVCAARPCLYALHQGCDGRGLVAGGLELRCDAKGLAGGHADTWAERSAAYYGAGDAVLQVRGKVVDSRRPGD
jgi:hypothetical protein